MLYKITGRMMRMLSGNRAHDLSLWGLKKGLVPAYGKQASHPNLAVSLGDVTFAHPIGLAPGFDKNAEALNALSQLGFGHLEVGAVTPKAQDGNPKPTIFRDTAHQAIINRMGFNNKGMDLCLKNIKKYNRQLPIGINIGKNKNSSDAVADYELLTSSFLESVDWITINVSSPNTVGLRSLQEVGRLKEIIQSVKNKMTKISKPPLLFVKIAPDLCENDLIDLAQLFKKEQIDAVVTTNTTLSRPSEIESTFANEAGGLSGRPLFPLSFQVQKIMANILFKESSVKIIASGGIEDTDTAWQRIIYGASLIQIYSAMIWKGPYLAANIANGLSRKLKEEGFTDINQAIGSAL